MKVSVITVCKNAQDTIEKTIQSVISQSYINIEYIIIDGKSTDKTVEIIKKYADHVSYFISEEDHSVYEAMNKGIAATTGDILQFLNANDYFINEKVIELVVKNFDKDVDLLCGNILIYDETTGHARASDISSIEDRIDLFYAGFAHPALFYRRNCFITCGTYSECFKIVSDYEWNVKALLQFKLKYKFLDAILTVFCLGGLSTSSHYTILHNKERELVIKTYYNKLERYLFNKRFFQLIMQCRYLKRALAKILDWKLEKKF